MQPVNKPLVHTRDADNLSFSLQSHNKLNHGKKRIVGESLRKCGHYMPDQESEMTDRSYDLNDSINIINGAQRV